MPQPSPVHLKDYKPYPFAIAGARLRVELDPDRTKVTACAAFRRNPLSEERQAALELDGERLELCSVSLDGRRLGAEEYTFAEGKLRLAAVPDQFELEVETIISPAQNTSLEGLYISSSTYCTQCEAEGFRRLTCWPDRPDVLAVFTVTVIGPEDSCPVLLANGNLSSQGRLEDGRLFATWHDPFPKPSYLFALVAGRLVRIEDRFVTRSGRTVALHIYAEERNSGKCGHAMQSLKKAMRWDEEAFDREYDLDVYMIVVVDDFNMGAMENKGLNIFNSKYVLAHPETATDSDCEGVEKVVAHEYFHNWTGNRVTCRDWFQLSLKEGLTVFRDQEFSSDMGSRAVHRIQDASYIRNAQFREDSGPTAHPVRPESYAEINNFYTATVYDKGAEVIRMLQTLTGAAGFRKGMDLYFERHDGQAVTCEDFLQAMQDANGLDLSQFRRWYSQAGTPELGIVQAYDPERQEYLLTVTQTCPATPGQPDKLPFLMPLRIGLMDSRGGELRDEVLLLDQERQEFRFSGIAEAPFLSCNRNFSAPVKVRSDASDDELAFLMAYDTDPFNRWDAGQQLSMRCLLRGIAGRQQSRMARLSELLHQGFARLLGDLEADPALLALSLPLPTETWISQQMEVIDPEAVFAVRQGFRSQLRQRHSGALLERYWRTVISRPCQYSAGQAGLRALRNCCLAYLLAAAPGEQAHRDALLLGIRQYRQADNMTDAAAALSAVVNADRESGDMLLEDFYARWQHEPLVVDKWLAMQAGCVLPGALTRVQELLRHPAYNVKSPNKVRALVGTFCANLHQFHAADGSGYAFIAEQIGELDRLNPQVAARMLSPLAQWRRYDPPRQGMMRVVLEFISRLPRVSRDVSELAGKSIGPS